MVKIEVEDKLQVYKVMSALAINMKRGGTKVLSAKLDDHPEEMFEEGNPTTFMVDPGLKEKAVAARKLVMKKNLPNLKREEVEAIALQHDIDVAIVRKLSLTKLIELITR